MRAESEKARGQATWQTEGVLRALRENLAKVATQAGLRGGRCRLVLLDFERGEELANLKRLGEELGLHVQTEKFPRRADTAQLDDRLSLLSRSPGIHGLVVSWPLRTLLASRLSGFENLKRLDLDAPTAEGTPQIVTFLQLARANGLSLHSPLTVALICDAATVGRGRRTEQQLGALGVKTELVTNLDEGGSLQAIQGCRLLWLCRDEPVDIGRLHLDPHSVVFDAGAFFGVGSCLSLAQKRLLSWRQRGFYCAQESGAVRLVDLNRLLRLFARNKRRARKG